MNESFQRRENKIDSRVDDDYSLKDIILKIQDWWRIIWPRRTRIFLLSMICGLSVAIYMKLNTRPTYTASYQLFFQEENKGLSGAMRLASSFGLGGISGGFNSSIASVKQFMTSRSNIADVITAELENGRLIDRYYSELINEDKVFAEEFLRKFGFNKRYTDSTITHLFYTLNNDNLTIFIDEESGILSLDVKSLNEGFAFDLANILVQFTEEKFKNWKRESSMSAVRAFQSKVDSLETDIDMALLQLGQYEDQNNSLVSAVDKMKRMRLTIDLESLKVAFGEYLKGLEMSKVELMNLEPPFKYFDKPTYPLSKEKKSALKGGVFGTAITAFLLVFFFIGREEYGKLMAD